MMTPEEELVKLTVDLKIAKDECKAAKKVQERLESEELKELQAKKAVLLKEVEKQREYAQSLTFWRKMLIGELEHNTNQYRLLKASEERKKLLTENLDSALAAVNSIPTTLAMIKRRHATGAPSTSQGKRSTFAGRPSEDTS